MGVEWSRVGKAVSQTLLSLLIYVCFRSLHGSNIVSGLKPVPMQPQGSATTLQGKCPCSRSLQAAFFMNTLDCSHILM